MFDVFSFLAGVLAADEFIAQPFHFDGEDFDFFREITPRDERRNTNEQADERRPQNVADARCQLARVVQPGLADVAEYGDHADDGADKSEQRRDADDDFQDDEAAFEPDDFVARGGFERIHIVGLGPVEMRGGEQEQATERRRVFFAEPAEIFHVVGRATFREPAGDWWRQYIVPAQHPAAPDHDAEAGHRSEAEQKFYNCFHKFKRTVQ